MKRHLWLVLCLALGPLLLAPVVGAAGRTDRSVGQDSAWQIESDAGSRLPGVNPSAVSQDLTIVSDAATRPLAEALLKRFEQEGYRGIGTVARQKAAQGPGAPDGPSERAVPRDGAVVRLETVEHSDAEARDGGMAVVPLATRSVVFVMGEAMPDRASVPRSDLPRLLRKSAVWTEINSQWPSEPIIRLVPPPEDTMRHLLGRTLGDDGGVAGRVVANPAARLSALREHASGLALTEYLAARRSRDVRTLEVDGMPATDTTIRDGSYPLTWLTVLSVGRTDFDEQPAAAAFAVFTASYAAEEVTALGWYPLPRWQSADALLKALGEEY